MTTIEFLAEWALRSSALIASGAALLWVLRVKDASIRLAAWTAMLAGSLAIPALTQVFPQMHVAVTRIMPRAVEAPAVTMRDVAPELVAAGPRVEVAQHFDWPRAGLLIWAAVSLALLFRLAVGLAMTRRLLRGSRATERETEGIPIRESDGVGAPVTLGIARPAIVLPPDWREWEGAKLDAVLAHERAHIRRHDPAVQLASAVHRALLWHSPLSWFLHRRIVRVAEEASDDAAVAVARDRAFYAEVLLEFMQRGVRGMNWLGVPMARYGRGDARIHRILDGTTLSRGVTRWSVAVILAFGFPLAYVAATANAAQAVAQTPPRITPPQTVQSAPAPVSPPAQAKQRLAIARLQGDVASLNGLGNVSAMTITVRSKTDGELKSVGFDEGKPVEAGQLLASVVPNNANNAMEQLQGALADLARDKMRFKQSAGQPAEVVLQLENQVIEDQRKVDGLTREAAYAQIRAPFAGVAGLRKVDPGNFVHAGDTLVVITQLQPIAVVFTLPEDDLPQVQARLREGASLAVEAWNRDMTLKLASGSLAAIDNVIDESSGTVKLKATFENKDRSLFPNQFVNVRLLMNR